MKCQFKKTGAWTSLGLLLCALLAPGSAQTPERRQLDQALAIEEPQARITALERFLEAHPNSKQAETAREEMVRSWAQMADTELLKKNIDQAMSYFRRALAVSPRKVSDRFFEETAVRIPLAASARGYRDEAVMLARELEARFQTEPRKLATMGEFYLSVEASLDAIRALELAAQLAPDEAAVHSRLGAAYRQGLRLDDAAAEYQQAIGLDARDKQSYFELANLYRAQGAYEEAVKLYRQQLEMDPKHIPSLKGLALTLLAQRKEDLAVAALNQAQKLRGSAEEIKQDLYLQAQLAFYYLAQRKILQARQAAETAIAIEPRYSWARMAAAEVDLAEDRYFDAERNLLAAMRYANFPTLHFTLGRVYLAVEDFEGALAEFAKAFSFGPPKEFKTRLGGVFDVRANGVEDLLARERQAALFIFEPPATEAQYRLVEGLVRLDARLREAQSSSPGEGGASSGENTDLEQAAAEFIEAEASRRPFRMLYTAARLASSGQALELAVKLAEQALDLAEVATEPQGSIRDYPNYDREGRRQIFRGRAEDARGWALLKLGRHQTAIAALNAAVAAYGALPEKKRALWHLAAARETVGDLQEALDLYIAAYEPPSPSTQTSDFNRAIIEVLYRKLHGSLQGLDERIGNASGLSDSSAARDKRGASVSVSQTAAAAPSPSPAPNASKEQTVEAESPVRQHEAAATTRSELTLPEINRHQELLLLPLAPAPLLPFPEEPVAIAPAPDSEAEKSSATRPRFLIQAPSATEPQLNTRPRRVASPDPTQTSSEPQPYTRKRRVKGSNNTRSPR